jgi:hypothetical protein
MIPELGIVVDLQKSGLRNYPCVYLETRREIHEKKKLRIFGLRAKI